MITIGVGIPAYRGIISSGHARMWMGLGMAIMRHSDRVAISAFADIDLNGIDNARNTLLQIGRHGHCDWMLMIDADNWVDTGNDLVRMIIDAEDKQASVVGAIVRTRGLLSPLNVYRFREQRRIEGEERVVRVEPIEQSVMPVEMFEVDSIGGAVLAVHLDRCKDSRFAFSNRDGINISEDLEFCRQVKELGGTIWADPRVKTIHVNKPDLLLYEPTK